jgi:molybdopterin synthase sulfur carrier subunit
MDLEVLYFAGVADLVGMKRERIEVPGDARPVSEVIGVVVGHHPALGGRLDGVRVAINEAFASDTDIVHTGDTLAFIPPVSGG